VSFTTKAGRSTLRSTGIKRVPFLGDGWSNAWKNARFHARLRIPFRHSACARTLQHLAGTWPAEDLATVAVTQTGGSYGGVSWCGPVRTRRRVRMRARMLQPQRCVCMRAHRGSSVSPRETRYTRDIDTVVYAAQCFRYGGSSSLLRFSVFLSRVSRARARSRRAGSAHRSVFRCSRFH